MGGLMKRELLSAPAWIKISSHGSSSLLVPIPALLFRTGRMKIHLIHMKGSESIIPTRRVVLKVVVPRGPSLPMNTELYSLLILTRQVQDPTGLLVKKSKSSKPKNIPQPEVENTKGKAPEASPEIEEETFSLRNVIPEEHPEEQTQEKKLYQPNYREQSLQEQNSDLPKQPQPSMPEEQVTVDHQDLEQLDQPFIDNQPIFPPPERVCNSTLSTKPIPDQRRFLMSNSAYIFIISLIFAPFLVVFVTLPDLIPIFWDL